MGIADNAQKVENLSIAKIPVTEVWVEGI